MLRRYLLPWAILLAANITVLTICYGVWEISYGVREASRNWLSIFSTITLSFFTIFALWKAWQAAGNLSRWLRIFLVAGQGVIWIGLYILGYGVSRWSYELILSLVFCLTIAFLAFIAGGTLFSILRPKHKLSRYLIPCLKPWILWVGGIVSMLSIDYGTRLALGAHGYHKDLGLKYEAGFQLALFAGTLVLSGVSLVLAYRALPELSWWQRLLFMVPQAVLGFWMYALAMLIYVLDIIRIDSL